jgi:hypothetical protein
VISACSFNEAVCAECKDKGHVHWDPALRACAECIARGTQCVRCVVIPSLSDSESQNKGAMNIVNSKRDAGTINKALSNVRPFPDPVHVGKSKFDSLANWYLTLAGSRICLTMLRTLRDDELWAGQKYLVDALPLAPLTARDKQAPANLLHIGKPEVVTLLQEAKQLWHTVAPDKYRKFDGNRALAQPAAVCTDNTSLYVLEAETGVISQLNWHNPMVLKRLGQCDGIPHAIAVSRNILFATVPSTNSIMYLELKTRSSELNPNDLGATELRRELKGRDEQPEGSSAAMRRQLAGVLQQERDARFGAPEANAGAGSPVAAAPRSLILTGIIVESL